MHTGRRWPSGTVSTATATPCSSPATDVVHCAAMAFPYEEFDLSSVRTYPLAERQSKAQVKDCGKPVEPGSTFAAFFASLPAMLGAADLRRVVAAMVEARRTEGGIIWGLG